MSNDSLKETPPQDSPRSALESHPFTVLICCYGDYPHYSLRAVHSILEGFSRETRPFFLHVGANQCGKETISELRRLCDDGFIDTLLESPANINKDPMMRLLLECTTTKYFMWMDDDSYVTSDWWKVIKSMSLNESHFDVAGKLLSMDYFPAYVEFLKKRPWFKSMTGSDGIERTETHFALGSLFIARTEFLRENDFPDRLMVKRHDDALLGDLIAQTNGRLLRFPENMNNIFCEDRGERRGVGEDDSAFSSTTDSKRGARASAKNPTANDYLSLNEEGNRLCQQKQYAQALARYTLATQIAPHVAEIHYNLANTHKALGDLEKAKDCYLRAIELKPDYVDALNNLGLALSNTGLVEQAIEYFQRALRIDARNATVLYNLANTYNAIHETDSAAQLYKAAIESMPNLVNAHFNLGKLEASRGNLQEAILHLRRAVYFQPENFEVHEKLAWMFLQNAEYEIGFEEYEERLKNPKHRSNTFAEPRWKGECLEKKTILAYQEGSCADALLFVRYIEILRDQGASVIVECHPALRTLFARLPEIEAFSSGEQLPLFDMQVSLNSLAVLFEKTFKHRFSAIHNYIIPPRHAPIKIKTAPPLSLKVGFLLGDAFSAKAPSYAKQMHGILHEISSLAGIALYDLSETSAYAQYQEGSPIQSFQKLGDSIHDLSDMAFAVKNLDLLVAPDCTTAHLAAAMGKEVFLVLGHDFHWCWQSQGTSTPWYPTLKIYRTSDEESSLLDVQKSLVADLLKKTR